MPDPCPCLPPRALPGDAAEDLSSRLELPAPRLVERTLEEMYFNLFWDDRFGARGRRFASEDGHCHVSYLAEALRWQAPMTWVRCATWLQACSPRAACARAVSTSTSLPSPPRCPASFRATSRSRSSRRAATRSRTTSVQPARCVAPPPRRRKVAEFFEEAPLPTMRRG